MDDLIGLAVEDGIHVGPSRVGAEAVLHGAEREDTEEAGLEDDAVKPGE